MLKNPLYTPSTNPLQRGCRGGQQLNNIAMPLDLANGLSWWCSFLDGGCSQVVFAYYSYVNNLQECLFFVLLCCVVKCTNIFYSRCKESSCSEFGNSRQWLFFHIGINSTLQTRRIYTREGFFCNIWYHTGWKPVTHDPHLKTENHLCSLNFKSHNFQTESHFKHADSTYRGENTTLTFLVLATLFA